MSRLRIVLPESFSFATELTVRVGDVNYGGHLGNDALLGLIHEARLRWLASFAQSETDFFGLGLIQIDLQVVYRQQAFRGDCLRVEIAAAVDGSRFSITYRVSLVETEAEVARVQTGMACFDYTAQKAKPLPEDFHTFLANH